MMARRKYRFHLLGLAHLPTVREISTCAYTQKILKLAHMLKGLGHTVFFYGVEGSDVPCDEFIQCLTKNDLESCYGKYDIKREFFKHDGQDYCYKKMNNVAAKEINKRKERTDFLLITMGNYQKLCADQVQLENTVEAGIGYSGIFTKRRVFESYAWMHYLYGCLKQDDGGLYDCVIPNYFFPEDFPYGEGKGDEKGEYMLYMGRFIRRKGLQTAVETAKACNKRLIMVGQGNAKAEIHNFDHFAPWLDIRAAVGPEERAKLQGNALCAFATTSYIEPFGGVAVEHMFTGTPIITSDFGVFPEYNVHGVTGYRVRTLDDCVFAVNNCAKLDRKRIREYAVANYSCDRISEMYQEYFDKCYDVITGCGWYDLHPERTSLNWLSKVPA